MTDKLPCKTCGEDKDYYTVTRVFTNKTKHTEAKCVDCKGHIKFMAQDQAPQDFIMPFGKHKGTTLGEIQRDHPEYLEWMIKQDIDRRILDRIELVITIDQI